MNWLTQSFIGLASAAGMMILVLTRTKIGISVNFIMMLIAAVWLPSFAFLTYREGVSYKITFTTILIIIAAGIASVLGNYFQFNAANSVPNAGMVYAIMGCASVLVAIFAWLFFDGRLTFTQIIGILLCVGGIVLLSLKK